MSTLSKEIITTTTEKFGEEGKVVERITETVEKIYQEKREELAVAPLEVEAAKEIDRKKSPDTQVPFENSGRLPLYDRSNNPSLQPSFPWEHRLEQGGGLNGNK